ncbi:hypothetical protein EYF80_000547 [Liparis tanakae]|uniref:Uncharacterized protein n=1 Tax=Liparis tanakae TaxID=230148 RepID=A0A4Z2JG69_9TELE|nr:hypothetical protein EYF80_000547 [Liparis tanakae]
MLNQRMDVSPEGVQIACSWKSGAILPCLAFYTVGEGRGGGLEGLNAGHLALRPVGRRCGWPLSVPDVTSRYCSLQPEKLREEMITERCEPTAAGTSRRLNSWAQTVRLKIIPAKGRLGAQQGWRCGSLLRSYLVSPPSPRQRPEPLFGTPIRLSLSYRCFLLGTFAGTSPPSPPAQLLYTPAEGRQVSPGCLLTTGPCPLPLEPSPAYRQADVASGSPAAGKLNQGWWRECSPFRVWSRGLELDMGLTLGYPYQVVLLQCFPPQYPPMQYWQGGSTHYAEIPGSLLTMLELGSRSVRSQSLTGNRNALGLPRAPSGEECSEGDLDMGPMCGRSTPRPQIIHSSPTDCENWQEHRTGLAAGSSLLPESHSFLEPQSLSTSYDTLYVPHMSGHAALLHPNRLGLCLDVASTLDVGAGMLGVDGDSAVSPNVMKRRRGGLIEQKDIVKAHQAHKIHSTPQARRKEWE